MRSTYQPLLNMLLVRTKNVDPSLFQTIYSNEKSTVYNHLNIFSIEVVCKSHSCGLFCSRKLSIFTMRLASLLVLHAAGAGLASPTVLVSRPVAKVPVEWLPIDNQTVYRLGEGESKRYINN